MKQSFAIGNPHFLKKKAPDIPRPYRSCIFTVCNPHYSAAVADRVSPLDERAWLLRLRSVLSTGVECYPPNLTGCNHG